MLLHADPVALHCGAHAGVDPAHVLSIADGVVMPSTDGPQPLEPFVDPGRRADSVVAANVTVVSALGGRPQTLADDLARAEEAGATQARLHHAGLASDADLAHVAAALALAN
ncbi:hypothetical protein ACH4E8_24770 [Streptomyces sp. NPDC017979]|uniref:hypothetical protein n=1 Tax=Streptomyces sp. NPDC017979 TaxID=3365024 RepID=UPI00379789EE